MDFLFKAEEFLRPVTDFFRPWYNKILGWYLEDPHMYMLGIIALLVVLLILFVLNGRRRPAASGEEKKKRSSRSKKIRYEDIDWNIHTGETADPESGTGVKAESEGIQSSSDLKSDLPPELEERSSDYEEEIRSLEEMISEDMGEPFEQPEPTKEMAPIGNGQIAKDRMAGMTLEDLRRELNAPALDWDEKPAKGPMDDVLSDLRRELDSMNLLEQQAEKNALKTKGEEAVKPVSDLETDADPNKVVVEQINLIKAVPSRKYGSNNRDTNRAGRIFTEEELKKQIR